MTYELRSPAGDLVATISDFDLAAKIVEATDLMLWIPNINIIDAD